MGLIKQGVKGANLNLIAQTQENRASRLAGGLSNISSMQANVTNKLASSLSSIGSELMKRGNMISEKEAEQRAIVDVHNGMYQNQDRDTIYGIAYANAYDQAYASKVAIDAKAMSDRLEAQHYMNPQGYLGAYNKYANETIKSAPTPALQSVSQNAFVKYGNAAYGALYEEKLKVRRQNNIDGFKKHQDMLADEYEVASMQRDIAKQKQILDDLTQLQSSAVHSGYVGQGEVAAYNRIMVKEGEASRIISTFDGTIESYQKFAANIHPMFTAEEKDKITKQLMHKIDTEVKLYDLKEKRLDDAIQKGYKESRALFKRQWEQGSLSQAELDKALEDDKITVADYDNFSKRVADPGLKYDDTAALLNIKTHLTDVSEDQILDAPLTNKTKMDLINERNKFFESGNGKWTSSIEGREAISRIKRKFNIVEGGIINFGNSSLVAYDKVYRTFFDRVMALPVEQRADKVLEISDAVIKEYDEGVELRIQQTLEEQQRKKEEEARLEAENEKNSKWNKFKQSMSDWADETFTSDPGVSFGE